MSNMRMSISELGLRFIAEHESYIGHVYIDFAGNPTKGYGHLMRPGDSTAPISKADAISLLRLDVRSFEDAINRLVVAPLEQVQFDALVSLTFNVGVGAFAKSKMLKKLNDGDYEGAALEFDGWDRYSDPVTKKRLVSPTLTERRAKEKAKFLSAVVTKVEPRGFVVDGQSVPAPDMRDPHLSEPRFGEANPSNDTDPDAA